MRTSVGAGFVAGLACAVLLVVWVGTELPEWAETLGVGRDARRGPVGGPRQRRITRARGGGRRNALVRVRFRHRRTPPRRISHGADRAWHTGTLASDSRHLCTIEAQRTRAAVHGPDRLPVSPGDP